MTLETNRKIITISVAIIVYSLVIYWFKNVFPIIPIKAYDGLIGIPLIFALPALYFAILSRILTPFFFWGLKYNFMLNFIPNYSDFKKHIISEIGKGRDLILIKEYYEKNEFYLSELKK